MAACELLKLYLQAFATSELLKTVFVLAQQRSPQWKE